MYFLSVVEVTFTQNSYVQQFFFEFVKFCVNLDFILSLTKFQRNSRVDPSHFLQYWSIYYKPFSKKLERLTRITNILTESLLEICYASTVSGTTTLAYLVGITSVSCSGSEGKMHVAF